MAGAELIGKEEIKEVMDVLETGILMRYGFDKERKGIFKVREFEEAFARYCGASHALGVTSGSAALKVALTALDVGPGDDVLVPAFTFLATYEAVLEVGAIPVMVDIDDTLNLDPLEIEKKKTPYTKAVIPVHMCGSAAHIDQIVDTARKNHLLVLEDNAQGCGASFKGKKLGSFGDMGCFSFDYVKTVTTGEGGMVITNNLDLYHRAEWYHDHGHDHNPNVSRAMEGRTILGFNYRMNELQGALGLAQLRKLDDLIGKQKKIKNSSWMCWPMYPVCASENNPIPKAIPQHSWRLISRMKIRRRNFRTCWLQRGWTRCAIKEICGTMFRIGSIFWQNPRPTQRNILLPVRSTRAKSNIRGRAFRMPKIFWGARWS